MKNKILWVLTPLAVIVLFLAGCSDFDEMKSQRLLINAEAQLQQGNEPRAEVLLLDLLAKYPETAAANSATRYLQKIVQKRQLHQYKEFYKILDSYRQVLDGYRTMYATYPRTIAELDQGGYFFDSAYLEEIIPDGYQVYLRLTADGSGYSLWCTSEEQSRGYLLENSNSRLTAFDRVLMLNELKERFETVDRDGKLIVLNE